MKKQKKVIEKTTIVFAVSEITNRYSRNTRTFMIDKKVYYKRIPFPSYAEAIHLATNYVLGLSEPAHGGAWKLHNGYLSYRYKPVQLICNRYTPGKGTVVFKINLGEP